MRSVALHRNAVQLDDFGFTSRIDLCAPQTKCFCPWLHIADNSLVRYNWNNRFDPTSWLRLVCSAGSKSCTAPKVSCDSRINRQGLPKTYFRFGVEMLGAEPQLVRPLTGSCKSNPMRRQRAFHNPKRKRGTELLGRHDGTERSLANASGYERPSKTSSGLFQSRQ